MPDNIEKLSGGQCGWTAVSKGEFRDVMGVDGGHRHSVQFS